MEQTYDAQFQLSDAMEKLFINMKKDGEERKSMPNYYKRKLETLESYWSEYQNNHLKLLEYQDNERPYFARNDYEKSKHRYDEIKNYIIKGHDQPLAGSSKSVGDSEFETAQPVARGSLSVEKRSCGSTSKFDDMMRKQFINLKAFMRTVDSIELEEICDRWEFEDVLSQLHQRWRAVDSLHWEIENELDGDTCEEYLTSFLQHEKTFNNMKKAVNSKLWAVSHREKSTPPIDVPSFSGNYHQWTSFKDLFNEAVHLNPTLSKAKKMQYLKSKLRGDAERLIQHLPISAENYLTSWDLLKHRFENKKLIFSSHLNELLNLSNMQNQNLNQIKRMYDVTSESLNAIKNLGVDITTWDPMVVTILSQKLDSESHADYIQSLTHPRELPKLQEFLDFLEGKFTALEQARRKQDNTNQKLFSSINNKQPFPRKNFINQYQQPSTDINYKRLNKSFHISSDPNGHQPCLLCKENHGLFMCQKFLNMNNVAKLETISNLNICKNCLYPHYGKSCISTKRCRSCAECHNTLIHDACKTQQKQSSYGQINTYKSKALNSNRNYQQNVNNSSHVSQKESSEILLSTALVQIMAADGTYITLRALIDQGSQISLITESAAQLLGLKRRAYKGIIFGIGEKGNNCKGVLNINCKSRCNQFSFDTEVLIMNNLIKKLPNLTFNKPSWQYIQKVDLADPEFYISRPIDLLLGAEIYANIMLEGIIRGENQSQPLAQQTQLGWLLCGSIPSFHCNVTTIEIDNIHKFWELEEVEHQAEISKEDQICINLYNNTTKRLEDGRYEVKMPLHDNYSKQLGLSKEIACAQFRNLEKKFEKQSSLAEDYKSFIREYQELGHMKQVDIKAPTECFLPHHAVQRPNAITTKLRVVFNASAKTSSGKSLNDVMYKGPNLQQDLQALILKWRQFKYAYTADLEKMYRQIVISEEQQSLQKIVWRDTTSELIREYQLTTVTYGTKAAPYLAMMTLKKLANDESDKYPDAANIIKKSMYTDDLIYGSHNIQTGQKLIYDLCQLVKLGGFMLRKWSANNTHLLENLKSEESSENNVFTFKSEETEKTLGILWNSSTDQLSFKCNISKDTPISMTKRKLLAEISKIFDPLGWLAPVVIKLKILFQHIWIEDLQWDDVIPEHIYKEWFKLKSEINIINEIELPRWLGCTEGFHGFCDASMKAYAACVYARIKKHEQWSIVLVTAKTKLAPNKKPISLPRLELSGAQLLSKLISKISECYEDYNIKVYGWTDSMVVLGWLNGDSKRWKSFVANRVDQIVQIMPSDQWRYIKTSENPADAASRGLSAKQLKNHKLWWQGPAWLTSMENIKDKVENKYTTNHEMRIKQVCTIQKYQDENIISHLLQKHNSFITLTRVLAWILRALNRSKQSRPTYITLQEMTEAKMRIIKYVQYMEFGPDIERLQNNFTLKSKSNLLSLQPFLDTEGVLRVGGRLRHSNLPHEEKHPVIIPHDHRLTHLLIDQAHHLTYHGGAKLTLSNLRKKYWIIGGVRATKKHLRKCVTCRRHSPEIKYQLMGDLPAARVNPAPPFFHTGVDYTGFVDIKMNKGRGVRTTKGYIVVFVCMVTKAIHLEIVSDLSSSAFLAALRRMAARRGSPSHIYSDNGSNFVKADRVLQETYFDLTQILNKSFYEEITTMNIQWHFNAPSWPTAGGLWERAVRSLKHHMKRTIGDQKLTYEEYCTLLSHIEACLNSRPICALSENIEDLDCLTPAHFLTGRAGLTMIETEDDARTRWYLITKLQQNIWKKWKEEYLSQLTVRNKWLQVRENVKIGDMVIIKDDNLPAGKWAMGRITELHPGNDSIVRVVTLKTKSGFIKRPITKISILPIQQEQLSDENEEINFSGEENKKTGILKDKKSTKGAVGSRFLSLAIMVVYFMTLLSSTNASYSTTALNNYQSLYFDPVAKMKHIRDEWTLVVYFNMSPYWEGTTTINKFTEYLEKLCEAIKDQSRCNMILMQVRHDQQELIYYNTLLMNQDFGGRDRLRHRRGLINGIGYVANSLFGVLDERFAEQYTKDIESIKKNQKHLANLWHNQTSIVESEFNLLKRTEEVINNQHKIINKHLNSVDKATNYLKQQIQNLSISEDFALSAIAASNMLSSFKRLQETLINTLTDTYHGRFNIHLLTPEQLMKELQTISGQLTKDLCIPLDNIQKDFQKIYPLLHVKARMTNEYFIFEVKFPLTSRDHYELFNIIPVPRSIENNKMLSIIPMTNYIAINVRKDAFISTSYEEIQNCLHLDDSYLCTLRSPINHLDPDERFCRLDNNNKCKIWISSCKDEWTPLMEPNTYLYFTCSDIILRIICEEQVSSEKINKTGLIKFADKYMVKGRDFTFYSHDRHTNKNQLFINSIENIPKIAPINHLINVSISSDFSTSDDFTQINNSLASIHQQINKMKNEASLVDNELSPHDIHQYVLSYMALAGIIILGVVAAFWRWRRTRVPDARPQKGGNEGVAALTESASASVVNMGNFSASADCVKSIVIDESGSDKFDINSVIDTATSPIKKKRVIISKSNTFS